MLNSSASDTIVREGIGNLKLLNPDWVFTIYDNEDIEAFIKEKIPAKDYNLKKRRAKIELHHDEQNSQDRLHRSSS